MFSDDGLTQTPARGNDIYTWESAASCQLRKAADDRVVNEHSFTPSTCIF